MRKLIAYLSAAAIVFDIFTPFQLYFAGGKALMMLLPTVVIILRDNLILRNSFSPLLLYLLTCLGIMFAGSDYFNYPYLIQVTFAYSCIEHFLITKDMKFAKIVLNSVYVTLLVMVAVSLPLFISMPNLSRLMIDAEKNGIVDPIMYWTMQYSTLHALPIYSIPLFLLARNAKKYVKYGCIISIIAIFILMFYADTTTGVVVNIAIFAVFLLYNHRMSLNRNIARMLGVAVILMIVMNKTIMIGLLKLVQPIFAGSSTYVKIDLTIMALSGQGTSGDLESREELLNTTWNSFLSNPLLPELDAMKVGQHNFILDQIVVLGLFLSCFFVWFLIERIERPIKYLSPLTKPYYYMGISAFLIMGLVKNFFLILPAFSIVPMFLISEEFKSRLIIK